MNTWRIEDDHVVELLQQNGFICRRRDDSDVAFTIKFEFNPDQRKTTRWFETNLPIGFNGRYTLQDGSIVKSEGTSLVLAAQAR